MKIYTIILQKITYRQEGYCQVSIMTYFGKYFKFTHKRLFEFHRHVTTNQKNGTNK